MAPKLITNCLYWAWRQRRRHGGYIKCVRSSGWVLRFHFIWISEDFLSIKSFRPVDKRYLHWRDLFTREACIFSGYIEHFKLENTGMKFNIKGIKQGPELERFKDNWIRFTIHENKIILDDAKISPVQLLVINMFCGNDKGYEKADDMSIHTFGAAQGELEALFRARGRALAAMFEAEINNLQ